jgi:uncharacterized protein YoxC
VATPLDLVRAVPNGVLAGLRVLPSIAEHTAAMAEATKALPKIEKAMKGISKDTEALPQVAKDMRNVSKATDVLPPMDNRMAAIESTMPALVEVQRDLAQVPATLAGLDERLGVLSAHMDRLFVALDDLGEQVQSLHAAVGPLGRLADRFPGRTRE